MNKVAGIFDMMLIQMFVAIIIFYFSLRRHRGAELEREMLPVNLNQCIFISPIKKIYEKMVNIICLLIYPVREYGICGYCS